MTASTLRLATVSFSCLMCGLDTPSIEIRIDRLSRSAVRRALDKTESGFQPLWDASLTPHCPRCRGRLLLELGSVPAWRQQEVARQGAT
jgi:hypothetical protein